MGAGVVSTGRKEKRMADEVQYDYIVVGSGAGGGPLAANLARAGFKVLLLEAGGDKENLSYKVPAFNGLATEDQNFRWDFFVRHYTNQEQQQQDPKFVASQDGILYPRAGALGGCTVHNAMITIYPSNSDWNHIAEITNDDSWNADAMRKYFEKVEKCEYLPPKQIILGRHGDSGWLVTEKSDSSGVPDDWELQTTLKHCTQAGLKEYDLGPIDADLDPNAWKVAEERRQGFLTIPLATKNHARNGPREYIRAIAQQFPNNLTVQTHTFVTRILFDDSRDNVAIGVECLQGANLYRADPNSGRECAVTAPAHTTMLARREVILCGGAYNTPQLLMLSGIGRGDHLRSFGIDVRVDLPGVGQNLQDRYEVTVVDEMVSQFRLNQDSTFSDDPEYNPPLAQWLESRTGIYTSGGSALAYMKRSTKDDLNPDLFIFALASHFQGYFPLWFSTFENVKDHFTWSILKAHTKNTAGVVQLRSSDPLDTPYINFHYFEEGNNLDGSDLDAVVEAVQFVRGIMKEQPFVRQELIPGEAVQTEEEIKQYIRDVAWGHHCSCTCKIGADDDPMAVLDSNFRVRGTKNLRVVDASVFPDIPGYFIVLPIYMISEKAADVIIQDARA